MSAPSAALGAESEVDQTENGVESTVPPQQEEEAEIEKTTCNPAIPEDEDNAGQLERMRGDAIGDTLYSERFVLSTMLKLAKVERNMSDDEDFEKDLCALWDMTIEADVVLYLLQHDALDMFAQCICDTEDKRLIEILVGMMGNMCCVERARTEICDHADVIATLLALTSCGDALTLIQLMRLWAVALMNSDTGTTAEKWFAHFCAATPGFVQNLAFILSSSSNEILLRQALEALNAMLAKFAVIVPPEEGEQQQSGTEEPKAAPPMHFSEVFVKQELIKASTEAFKTLAAAWQTTAAVTAGDEVALPTETTRKVMETFLNIHTILTGYGENIKLNYRPHLQEVIACLNMVLEPLCEPACLLPLSSYEQNMLEGLSDVFMGLADPFDQQCFRRLIKIWQLVDQEAKTIKEKQVAKQPANDFEDDESVESEVDCENFLRILLDFISRLIVCASEQQLKLSLCQHTPQLVKQLLAALDSNGGTVKKELKNRCARIRNVYESTNGATKGK